MKSSISRRDIRRPMSPATGVYTRAALYSSIIAYHAKIINFRGTIDPAHTNAHGDPEKKAFEARNPTRWSRELHLLSLIRVICWV